MSTTTAKATKKVTEQVYMNARAAYVKADNESSALAVKRDQEVEKLNGKYNPKFAGLMQTMDDNFAIIQQYCEENKETMFALSQTNKSQDLEIGFKKGKHKVELVECSEDKEENKEQWESALGLMEKKMPDYVRTVKEISKAKLLEDRELQFVAKWLPKCGLQIVQDETFFIKVIKTKKK